MVGKKNSSPIHKGDEEDNDVVCLCLPTVIVTLYCLISGTIDAKPGAITMQATLLISGMVNCSLPSDDWFVQCVILCFVGEKLNRCRGRKLMTINRHRFGDR